jgi:hypothetical protein
MRNWQEGPMASSILSKQIMKTSIRQIVEWWDSTPNSEW